MSAIVNVSRRAFLTSIGLSGGVFVLGSMIPELALAAAAKGSEKEAPALHQLGYFVSVQKDGTVEIVCHRCEMGQGIITSVPQIIADELEADWSKVQVTLGKADSRYGNQSTGGSASIRQFFTHIRQMGAVARDMLEQAAANEWAVEKHTVKAQQHAVIHIPSGKKLAYGDLAAKAAMLPMPTVDSLKLKANKDFHLIGKDVKLVGQEAIVTGTAVYAQDIQLPNMLIASIERPPVVGGRIKSYNDSEAKKVAGVVAVVRLKDRPLPANVKPVSGVAVLASNTWAAIEGRKKLQIEWDLGEHASHDSKAYKQGLIAKVQKKGEVVRTKGDTYSHAYRPDKTVEATYTVPYHHHMSMETPAATAVIENGVCRVWTGTQTPQWGKGLVMEELGLDPEKDADKVELNVTLMGGAFGRKGKHDFTLEAVELANATKRPVKVIWSREDDVKHGYYHAIAANYCKAELTADNHVDFWIQRVAHPPIGWTFDGKSDSPDDGLLGLGFADVALDVNHLSCEKHKVDTHVRIGWFRSVENIHNWFALGCFVDELAAKANIPTVQMWLNLVGKDRVVDPRKEGFSGWKNYDQTSADYDVLTRRIKNVILLIAEKANINEKLPKNEAWGISFANSFNSYSAAATKVRVVDKKVTVLAMHTAIDCGLIVTPDRVRSQMEGAMIMGLSMALDSEITVKNGVIEQSNFNDYTVSRMPEVPPLFVHLVDSTDAPGGVGEPGLPAVIPSLVNAIYHASGIRIRDLPVKTALAAATV